jgi:translation initiation factor IF-2
MRVRWPVGDKNDCNASVAFHSGAGNGGLCIRTHLLNPVLAVVSHIGSGPRIFSEQPGGKAMTYKKHPPTHKATEGAGRGIGSESPRHLAPKPDKHLEVVLKCDSTGSVEALQSTIDGMQIAHAMVKVIHAGVGPTTKFDVDMALTGSKLVLGFEVDVAPHVQHLAVQAGVEIRLYNVIYQLTSDLESILRSWTPTEPAEKITGKARVIALFKSSRKGVIAGCEVLAGTLALGKRFRIISPMGVVYTGKIQSLHIEKDAVPEARVGQEVGLKMADFDHVKRGDLIECFEIAPSKATAPWAPKPGIFRLYS